jgi:D-3-phosphoglycerate dehydrogenase
MTRGIIDAKALARMKPQSLLVNVARGPLVVTGELVRALQAGRLAGAVMDVTDPEPLAAQSELWDMPNVIITPHVGGQGALRADDITRLFCENLRRWRSGQPLVNYLADKRLGFPIRAAGALLWGDLCDA